MSLQPLFSKNSLEDIVLALLKYLNQTETEYINDLYQILITLRANNRLKPLIHELIQLSSMPYINCFYQNATFLLPQPASNDVLRDWLLKSEKAYLQFISFYEYRPDDDTETIYIFKRPLHRVRVLAKFFKKVYELQRTTCPTVASAWYRPQHFDPAEPCLSLYLTFRNLVEQARVKIDAEVDVYDTNQFLFNNVRSFETLNLVSAGFDSNAVVYRDYFEFELDHHTTGVDWQPFMVEVFLVSSSAEAHKKVEQNIDSLVICSLEEPGRSMLFPAFRLGCLHLCSVPKTMDSTSVANRKLTLTNHEGSRFTLKCSNESQFNNWKGHLLKLFPECLEPTLSLSESIESFNKQTLSTSTSCYSFKSTKSEILTQQLNGLNIITNATINTARTSVDPLQLPLKSNIYTPQIENLPLTTSLVDAPELKKFMLEDSFNFDKQNFSVSLNEDVNILSLFKATVNFTRNNTNDENQSDFGSIKSLDYDTSTDFYKKAEDSHTIDTIDTTADTHENSADNDTSDATQNSDISLTDILDNDKDSTAINSDPIDSPISVLPRLPKSLPLYCPEVPKLATTPAPQTSFSIDLPKRADKYFSSPLELPSIIARKTQQSVSSKRVSKTLSRNASLETIEKTESASAAFDRRLSEGSKPSKLSKKRRLISALKSFSSKLKSKSSYSELDAEFEILSSPVSQKPAPDTEIQIGSPSSCHVVQHCKISDSSTDNNLTFVSVDVKERSKRALSRISEEHFFCVNEDDNGETVFLNSTDEANEDRDKTRGENDLDPEIDSSELPVVLTAVKAVKALPNFVKTSSRRASVAASPQIMPKLELTEEDEDNFAASCMLDISAAQAGIAVEKKLIDRTAIPGHTRTTSDGLLLQSIHHETLQGSLNGGTNLTSTHSLHFAHSRRSSKSSTTSGASIKKFGSDATLTETYQCSTISTSNDVHTSTKLRTSSSLNSLHSAPQNSLSFQTVSVLKRGKTAPTGSWIPVFKRFVTVFVSPDEKTITCWRALSASASDDSLRTICAPCSESNLESATAAMSSSSYTSTMTHEGKPLLTLELSNEVYVLKKSMYDVLVVLDTGDEFLFQLRNQAVTNEFYRVVSSQAVVPVSVTTRQTFVKTHHHTSLHDLKPTKETKAPSLSVGTAVSGRPLIVPPLLSSRASCSKADGDSRTNPALTPLLSDQRCLLFKATSASPDRWEKAGLALMTATAATGIYGELDWRRLKLCHTDDDSVMVDTCLPATCFGVAGPVALSISDTKTGQLKYLVRLRDQAERDRVAAALFGNLF